MQWGAKSSRIPVNRTHNRLGVCPIWEDVWEEFDVGAVILSLCYPIHDQESVVDGVVSKVNTRNASLSMFGPLVGIHILLSKTERKYWSFEKTPVEWKFLASLLFQRGHSFVGFGRRVVADDVGKPQRMGDVFFWCIPSEHHGAEWHSMARSTTPS